MSTSTNNTITGSIFIIPNHSVRANSKYWFVNPYKEYGEAVDYYGLPESWKPVGDDLMVHIWVYNETVDNWPCERIKTARMFGIDIHPEDEDWDDTVMAFPSHLPARVLINKQEGDVISFDTPNGKHVELTCCQTKFRYSSFGNFEDALKNVLF